MGIKSKHYISLIFLSLTLANACGQKSNSQANQPPADAPTTTNPSAPTPSAPPVAAGDAGDEMGSVNKATLSNLDDLITAINSKSWTNAGANCSGKKIAIFDNGYAGLDDSKGVRLPPNLLVMKAPVNAAVNTPHGTKLAEVIWALCTGNKVYSPSRPGPTLKLYNTNGYSNLSAAVDDVVASPVDMVLYSQVWEFGGNFDGRGFINGLVNKVTKSGVLWVNASGNYGQTTWQSQISFHDNSSDVKLPHEGRYVRFAVNSKQTPTKITLAWNDFTDDKTYRTAQDLDLFLEDVSHKEIIASRLIQDGQDHGSTPGYSSYAREQISITLDPGIYYLRISSPKPAAFNASSRLRLAADGQDLFFIDKTPEASVMIPADNPSVLTVGASDFDVSSAGTVVGSSAHKPEVLAPSVLQFDNGITFAGSSSSAAVAVAALAIYESKCPTVDHDSWVRIFGGELMGQKPTGAPAPILKLPDNAHCLGQP